MLIDFPINRFRQYGCKWLAVGAGSPAGQPYVPAHRVVNRTGLLTGKVHFGGPDVMKELLESEGIKVVDDQIVDFQKHFWDPMKELPFDETFPTP